MDIENIKKSCKDLIVHDLNNYNYITNYINTQITEQLLVSKGYTVNGFIEDIKSTIDKENPNLYCNIEITRSNSLLSYNTIILKIRKISK